MFLKTTNLPQCNIPMNKKAMVIVSDLHINHRTALCAPSVLLRMGDKHIPSDKQRKIWKMWLEFCEWTDRKCEDTEKIVVFVGDICDKGGDKNNHELISTADSDIIFHADEVLKPIIKNASKLIFISGTDFHDGKGSDIVVKLAANYTNTLWNSDENSPIWNELIATVNGVKIDIAHTSAVSSVPWSDGNVANKIAAETLLIYANAGVSPPDLVVRGHAHRPSDSADNYKTRAIILPSWQGINSFARQRKRLRPFYSWYGGIVVIFEDKKYDVNKLYWKPEEAGKAIWAKQL